MPHSNWLTLLGQPFPNCGCKGIKNIASHDDYDLILESPNLSESEIEKMIVQSAKQNLPAMKQVCTGFVKH